jgi:acetyl coenzyme A synthetase (ADP forming)-like protein
MSRSVAAPETGDTGVRDLEPMLAPRAIAVVGASRRPGSVGYALTRNLVYGGYTGVVYPVNPKAKSVLSLRTVPSLSAIDDQVDLAVIATPPAGIEGLIQEGADQGIRHFLVISAGFKEVGGEGAERERRLKALAQKRGLSIVGPNCLGIINTAPEVQMNATFATHMPRRGALGLISQSGALCTALLDYAKGRGIGFSRFVSFGNKVDVTEIELLRALAHDPHTNVILMYVEDLSAGQPFIEACHEVTHGKTPKPILTIKTGRTREGAAAAASHTGSLAGSDEVYDAIFKQAGVIRVESVGELFDCAEAFIDPTLPNGRGTAIVTNAGGPGIMATDACIRYGLKIVRFQDYTIKSLRFQMPPTGSIKNPVDVIGDAKHDRYRAALDAVTADEGVDQVAVIVTPQMMTDVEDIARVIAEIKSFSHKPIIGVLMGLVDVYPAVEILRKAGIPSFTFPENAMRALAAKAGFAEWVRRPMSGFRQYEVDRKAVAQLFDEELRAGRPQLVELPALKAFRHYGFPTVPFALAKSADEAVAAAEEMGYPVVMKISGPQILHKTDIGGVRLDLADEHQVRGAFDEMFASVRRHLGEEVEIWGVLIQKMLARGKEIILGVTRDPSFGPLLMFGLGGIYTEALRDVAFRLAPLREIVAAEMIKDIRSHRLLEGVRGEPPSDMAAIAECILRLSQLVTDHPSIQELDINPLMVYPRGQGAVIADARIILKES